MLNEKSYWLFDFVDGKHLTPSCNTMYKNYVEWWVILSTINWWFQMAIGFQYKINVDQYDKYLREGGYRGGQFYWWRKSQTFHKSLTNFYHMILYQVHLALVWFELTTLVVIGTDCIGSCKSNYHTIKTTTVPWERY
jgi:hypothetical protein